MYSFPKSSVMKTRLTISRTLFRPLEMCCQKSFGSFDGMYMRARYETPEPVSPCVSVSARIQRHAAVQSNLEMGPAQCLSSVILGYGLVELFVLEVRDVFGLATESLATTSKQEVM